MPAGTGASRDSADLIDDLEGRADRSLRVVLVSDRRPPDGHNRVANEFSITPPWRSTTCRATAK